MMNVTIPRYSCLYRAGSVFVGLQCRKAIRYFAKPDSRESGRVAGRNLHIPFLCQDAQGGVETATNRPIKYYRTITLTCYIKVN